MFGKSKEDIEFKHKVGEWKKKRCNFIEFDEDMREIGDCMLCQDQSYNMLCCFEDCIFMKLLHKKEKEE